MTSVLKYPIVFETILAFAIIVSGCASRLKSYELNDFVGVYVDTNSNYYLRQGRSSKALVSLTLYNDSICAYNESTSYGDICGVGYWKLVQSDGKAWIELSFENIKLPITDVLSGMSILPGERAFNVIDATKLKYNTDTFKKISSEEAFNRHIPVNNRWFDKYLKNNYRRTNDL